MVTQRMHELDSTDLKFQVRRLKRLERERQKARWVRHVAGPKPPPRPTKFETTSERNLKTYLKWKFRAKLKFAKNGYCFDPERKKPAIKIFTTTIRTVKGMSKGVQATKVLPYLPVGFLILFSFHSKVSKFVDKGVQKYYQIQVGKIVYLIDPEPRTKYGLANFVNAAVESSSHKTKKYRRALWKITKQKMHIPNVKFKVANSRNGRICRLRYPVYYTVTKVIKPGEELLVEANYGGEHIYPTEDIVR